MRWLTRAITLLLAAVIAIQGGARMFAGDTNFDHREQFILSEINRIRAEQGLSQLRAEPQDSARSSQPQFQHGRNRRSLPHRLSRTSFKARLGSIFVERYGLQRTLPQTPFPTPPVSLFKAGAKALDT